MLPYSLKNQHYINGQWLCSENELKREIINPGTGDILSAVAEGNISEAKLAVDAARKAFDQGIWTQKPAAERAAFLFKLADKIEEESEQFALLETLNNGKPLRDSQGDVADTVSCFRYYAGIIGKPSGMTCDVPDPAMQTLIVREPVGVCAQIVPWNYPLMMAAWKIAPALAAGNTIVFKPSELTPLSAIRLFEIMDELGLPPGVVNLVLGAGATVGQYLAESPDVDKVAFTGGTKTGQAIMKAAAGNIKNISLELGGKSPNIIFADTDIETAVDFALFGIFCNQGQVCSAGSRVLIQEDIAEQFIDLIGKRAAQIKVGRGDEDGVEMGSLISEAHLKKVISYIETGKKEGARLITGGQRIVRDQLGKGFFLEPTIFADCTPDMKIVREEIFGPVLVIQTFSDEADAIRLANDSDYGLAAGVFTKDSARAIRVVRKLRAGITWVNHYHPTFCEAPWGGYKQSGIGRELGPWGLEAYTEIKQININTQPEPIYWFEDRRNQHENK
jgi:betaine-aldehyde dehydrogenase